MATTTTSKLREAGHGLAMWRIKVSIFLIIFLQICRDWGLVVFLRLNQLSRPCLVPVLLQDLPFHNILLCTLILNPLFPWDILPTWLDILSCHKATRTCHQHSSKHLLVTARTISLWLQYFHNIKIVFLLAACRSLLLLLLPLDMGLEVQPAFRVETSLWILPQLLREQPLAMMMF